jgi:hypothetical protein
MPNTIDRRDSSAGSGAAARDEELARQEAIKRIEHKRRFWITTAVNKVVDNGPGPYAIAVDQRPWLTAGYADMTVPRTPRPLCEAAGEPTCGKTGRSVHRLRIPVQIMDQVGLTCCASARSDGCRPCPPAVPRRPP